MTHKTENVRYFKEFQGKSIGHRDLPVLETLRSPVKSLGSSPLTTEHWGLGSGERGAFASSTSGEETKTTQKRKGNRRLKRIK